MDEVQKAMDYSVNNKADIVKAVIQIASKIVYMAITYCVLVLGYACVNIPYGTRCGAMTQNIEERAKINTFRSVSAMIAIGIINIITVPLIAALGNGSDKRGYLLVAVIYG